MVRLQSTHVAPLRMQLAAVCCRWPVVVLGAMLWAIFGPTARAAEKTLAARTLQVDATLRAVQFVDVDHGWAVGDQGIILATTDGGENWLRQDSGTAALLCDLHFTSAQSGFVAGKWYEADTGQSRGILLRTHDGGKTWEEESAVLPGLSRLGVQRDGSLLVAGDWSPIEMGQLLHRHGSRSDWQSLATQELPLLSEFSFKSSPLLMLDREGVVYEVTPSSNRFRPLSFVAPGGRLWSSGEHGVVIDERGRISVSRDGGKSWKELSVPQPDAVASPSSQPTSADGTDLLIPHAAAILPDGNIWLAGTPATSIIHLTPQDTTRVYSLHEAFPGGLTQPIHALHFLDLHRGWAVGAYGLILATRDGGRTWRPQRHAGHRAMMMGVACRGKALPWAALGTESLEHGRRIVVAIDRQIATRQWAINPADGDPFGKTVSAAAQLGGGEVVPWSAAEEDLRSLLLAIKAYRPSVLVFGDDVDEKVVDRVLAGGVAAGVERIYQVARQRDRIDLTLHSSAILPKAGVITGDLWKQALLTVAPNHPIEERLQLKMLWQQTPSRDGATHLSAGLTTRGTQRAIPEGRRRNLQVLQARSAQGSVVQRLIEQSRKSERTSIESSLQTLLQQVPMEDRERFLRLVLERAEEEERRGAGAIQLYLVALDIAANDFSSTGLGKWSSLRRVAIEQSSEWQHAMARYFVPPLALESKGALPVAANISPFERGDRLNPNLAQAPQGPRDGQTPLSPAPPLFPAEIQQMSASTSSDAKESGFIVQGDPLWINHPAIILWRGRHGGEPLESWDRSSFERLSQSISAGAWRYLAHGERFPAIIAPAVDLSGDVPRPLLDGHLNDRCWERAAKSSDEIRSLAAQQSTLPRDPLSLASEHVRVTYDADFVYLGVSYVFSVDDIEHPSSHRKRDEELGDEARVMIEIDVDRDLLTSYRLFVDARGRTFDACDSFRAWNPRWYVATALSEGIRNVEIAIHRSDLLALPLVPGDRWRIRGRLIPPRIDEESPHSVDPADWHEVLFR